MDLTALPAWQVPLGQKSFHTPSPPEAHILSVISVINSCSVFDNFLIEAF
jgi:hypothetical protein